MKRSSLILKAGTYTMPANDFPGLTQLHLNENLLAAARSPPTRCELTHLELDLHAYPTGGVARLREAIAEDVGCSSTNIVVSNGSSELLRHLFLYLLRAGDTVMLPRPSWGFFHATAKLVNATVVEYQLAESHDAYVYDVGILREAIACKHPHVVVICSPNNPTGNSFDAAALVQIVQEHPETAFIVDQAYYGFTKSNSALDRLPLEAVSAPNVFVTRTFSKFLGMANLRIGYLVSNEVSAGDIESLSTVFGIPSRSQALAIDRLRDKRLQHSMRAEYALVRAVVRNGLQEMEGLTPYRTDANFVLVRCDERWSGIDKYLLSAGFVVKVEKFDCATQHLRITLADMPTMNALLRSLREFLSKENGT